MKYICKKFINHQNQEIFAISLSSCSHYNANFKLDQSVSAIHDSPPYFWDQWGWPPTEPLTVTHARAHWWTLDLANAFVSPGVNSRGELVPLHGASRRRLGDNFTELRENVSACRFHMGQNERPSTLACQGKLFTNIQCIQLIPML